MVIKYNAKRVMGIALISSLYLLLMAVIWWEINNIKTTVVEKQALNSAETYINLLASFRSLYTSEVINNLPKDQVTISHDYHQIIHGIPLPATLTIKIAEDATINNEGFEIDLFSNYPFPWRTRNKDEFSHQALETLQKKHERSFHQITQQGNETFLSYAKADIMRGACVNCHNTHPDSPKTDWAENDVRGVLSVKLPMTELIEATNTAFRDLMLFVFLIGAAVISINLYFILDQRNH